MIEKSFLTRSALWPLIYTIKSRIKAHPDIGPPEYRLTVVLMQTLSRFLAYLVIARWPYNQNVLLKDHRVKEKQYFKRLSVCISIKYRQLQCI